MDFQNESRFVNEDEIEERTTTVKDGPFDGLLTRRPPTRLRKVKHAKAFRLADENQPWQPGMPDYEMRVKFAVYLWLPAEMKYCWVDFVEVQSQEQLNEALQVVAAG